MELRFGAERRRCGKAAGQVSEMSVKGGLKNTGMIREKLQRESIRRRVNI